MIEKCQALEEKKFRLQQGELRLNFAAKWSRQQLTRVSREQ